MASDDERPGATEHELHQMPLAAAPEPTVEEQLRIAQAELARTSAELRRTKEQRRKLRPTKPRLSSEARQRRQKILDDYPDLVDDPAAELIIQTAFEAFDQMRRAQAIVAAEGEVFKDRFGQRKSHPLLVTIRDARSQFLDALKRLNLDLEPLQDGPGRPKGR